MVLLGVVFAFADWAERERYATLRMANSFGQLKSFAQHTSGHSLGPFASSVTTFVSDIIIPRLAAIQAHNCPSCSSPLNLRLGRVWRSGAGQQEAGAGREAISDASGAPLFISLRDLVYVVNLGQFCCCSVPV